MSFVGGLDCKVRMLPGRLRVSLDNVPESLRLVPRLLTDDYAELPDQPVARFSERVFLHIASLSANYRRRAVRRQQVGRNILDFTGWKLGHYPFEVLTSHLLQSWCSSLRPLIERLVFHMFTVFQGKNHPECDTGVSHAGRDLVLRRLDLNIRPDERSFAEDAGWPAHRQDQDAILLFAGIPTLTRPPDSLLPKLESF